MELDLADLADLVSRPGADTRQWLAIGLVQPSTDGDSPVSFNDENGAPIPQGVLVSVKLVMSGHIVPCRVLSQVAGEGESEWHGYGSGDEVLVAITDGDERAGCVILGKLTNSRDVFPQAVAGQDITKNNVAFKRTKLPYLLETAGTYLVRSALTGASIAIDPTGAIFLGSPAGSLAITHDVISLQDPDGVALVQIDPSKLTVSLQADTTSFVLDADQSMFLTAGSLAFGTAGAPPTGHAVTAEQVVAFVINVLATLANTGSFATGPLSAAVYNSNPPDTCVASLSAVVGPALLALAGEAPIGPAPGGEFDVFAASTPPIFGPTGALTLAMANLIAGADVTGFVIPGYGKPGLMF